MPFPSGGCYCVQWRCCMPCVVRTCRSAVNLWMWSPQGVGMMDSGPVGTLQVIGRAGAVVATSTFPCHSFFPRSHFPHCFNLQPAVTLACRTCWTVILSLCRLWVCHSVALSTVGLSLCLSVYCGSVTLSLCLSLSLCHSVSLSVTLSVSLGLCVPRSLRIFARGVL